jgi:2,4-dienoyl-CoA reductase-like NADH-dependent reductase (Old Yellow Enzyme family)
VLANRLVTAALHELYRCWGRSGVGLLVTGNVMIDREALSEPGQVALTAESSPRAFREWSDAARSQGSSVWMQLNHAGRQLPILLKRQSVAPSPIRLGPMFARPVELRPPEIQALVERFAQAASKAVRSGFDGVQIHAAHGYLISQFLSPGANARTDGYGGTPARRRRFLLEIVEAVRGAVGPTVPVSVKINARDSTASSDASGEVLDHVQALGASAIDLLEISGGDFLAAAMFGVGSTPQTDRDGSRPGREGYFLSFARAAKASFGKPLMVTGGFRSSGEMNAALASGTVDALGLARPMIVEPGLPHRLIARAGETQVLSALGTTPRSGRTAGLWPGLLEVSWYTAQLWRLARGDRPDPQMSQGTALIRYLGRQAAQQARLRRRRA